MPLTKAKHIQQAPGDPACFAAAACMATGRTLEEFKAFIGRDSIDSGVAYNQRDVAAWLHHNDMAFNPGAFITNVVWVAELPSEDVTLALDRGLVEALRDMADRRRDNIATIVNAILGEYMQRQGYELKSGERFVMAAGYDWRDLQATMQKTEGLLQYSININLPAIIITRPQLLEQRVNHHALYWDGAHAWDSARHPDLNPVDLEDYRVLGWHPVGRYSDTWNESAAEAIINEGCM